MRLTPLDIQNHRFATRFRGLDPVEVVLVPTTWPLSLIPNASLKSPPSVPRFLMTPFCQRKARV